jgi:hypothetical protein
MSSTPDRRAAWHEAVLLPLLFLTVALLGGLRIETTGGLRFLVPPLMALVLAVFVIAVLFRAGALEPARLAGGSRSGLENASGLVIALTLFAATTQVLSTLTPEAGLLALVFNVAWLVLFGNTLAARPDRARLLASLLVIFGAAFVVKYVLLGAMYGPDGGVTRRVVLALLEGVSLGTLAYTPPGPATGYVAFVTVLVYLVGVWALPRAPAPAVDAVVVAADLTEGRGTRALRRRADR